MGSKSPRAEPDPPDVLRGRERRTARRRTATTTRRRRSCPRSPGKPVRLQFMRWDEHGWDNYGPAQMMDIRGGRRREGQPRRVRVHRLRHPVLLDAAGRAAGDRATAGVLDRTGQGRAETTISGSQYNIPNRRVIGKSLPLAEQLLQASSFLRAPNNPQSAFAAEQAIDELAYDGEDGPGRLPAPERRHDDDRRRTQRCAKNVLTNVGEGRELAAQGRGVEPLERQRRHGPRHRVRLLLEHDDVLRRRHRGERRSTGKIVAKQLHVAGDAGLIVYPAGSENNEEGAAMQGLSRALVRAGRLRQEGRDEPRLGHAIR